VTGGWTRLAGDGARLAMQRSQWAREAAPRRARRAVATIFFVNGAVLASWVPHIPALKADHGIGDGRLGVVLLAMAVGSVLALPVAGWLVGRLGSRVTTAVAALGLCLALPLPVVSPTIPLVVVALALLGACNATLDVAMNAQAVAVEVRYGRPLMSSFHGLFSLGGVAGAAGASGAMALGLGSVVHVAAVAVAAAVVVARSLGGLLTPPAPAGRAGAVFVRPPVALLGLGLLTFCGLLAEGAVGDWSAVYLQDALGASGAVAATGFAAFSLTMAAGRFGGDHLIGRFGARVVLRVSSGLAAGGLAAALLTGWPPAAVVGFGLVGLGLANVVPVLFGSAGRVPGVPAGTALAAVATTGYCGYLAGPPLIGVAAEVAGLASALGLVSVACAVIAASARAVPTPTSEPDLVGVA
jgi:fucose permease